MFTKRKETTICNWVTLKSFLKLNPVSEKLLYPGVYWYIQTILLHAKQIRMDLVSHAHTHTHLQKNTFCMYCGFSNLLQFFMLIYYICGRNSLKMLKLHFGMCVLAWINDRAIVVNFYGTPSNSFYSILMDACWPRYQLHICLTVDGCAFLIMLLCWHCYHETAQQLLNIFNSIS